MPRWTHHVRAKLPGGVSLQHDDAGIRRLGLLKLLDFYGLPHFLQNLKVDPESKRTNCLKRLQPLESLPADGGCIADSDVGPQRREDGGGRYM
ncbi:unnamed protein product, partial [Durusdinium trenchii]